MGSPETRVTKLLDAAKIRYRLLPHTEPVFTVEAAARQRGVVKEAIVKAILLRDRQGQYVMACSAGNARVDPRAVRALLPEGWTRLHFATEEEILAVTGYVQGAVAPIGLPTDVPVIFDDDVALHEQVTISSGDVMAGLELASRDLIVAAGARLAPIAERKSGDA